MAITLAIDVYGTLINTHGLIEQIKVLLGDQQADQATTFSQLWRDKQLEYSFRRGLMGHYAPFSVCTEDALAFTCETLKTPLTFDQRASLLKQYQTLPAFADVHAALSGAKATGANLYAFTNGALAQVNPLLEHAKINKYLIDVVSADEIKTFKPDPKVYRHFLERAGATARQTWLISSNPFDIIGASAVGIKTAWIKRNEQAVFDRWSQDGLTEVKPNVILSSLNELAQLLTMP
jgi:2-haloacid dehalogenase